MRWKTTLFLLLVTLAIGTYVSLYELKRPTPEEQKELAHEVVRLTSDEVTGLLVTLPQVKVSLQRRNGSWRLTSPLAVRADEALVRRVLQELEPLTAERALNHPTGQPLALGEFGLSPPQATLTALAGTHAVNVLFGTTTAVDSNRYVKLADSPTVFVVNTRLFDAMNQPLDAYRSHELLDVDAWNVNRIAVTSPHASYALSKQAHRSGSPGEAPAGGGRWQLTEPLVDEADSAAVSTTLNKLRGLRGERFITETPRVEQVSDWGFDTPSAHITIGFDNQTAPRELFIGHATTDEPEEVYVKRVDEATIYAVKKAQITEIVQDPQTLRSHTVLDVVPTQVRKVELSTAALSWTLEQRQGTWQLADGRALDGSKVEEWLGRLRDLTLTRFVEDHPPHISGYGLEPPEARIAVWLNDSKDPNTLMVGQTIGQGKTRYGWMAGRSSVVELPETISELLSTRPESFLAPARAAAQQPSLHNTSQTNDGKNK